MMKRLNSAAGFALTFAAMLAFLSPEQAALAHGSTLKSKTTTVTTTTKTVTSTVKARERRHLKKQRPVRKSYAKKPHRKVLKRWDKRWEKKPTHRIKTKRDKLKKLETKRHNHYAKGYDRRHQRIRAFNHKHGRHAPHTHRNDDFINISPKAKQWPTPKPHASLLETLPVPLDVIRAEVKGGFEPAKEFKVAVVVKEESNGVTIIRNVKEIRDSGVDVPSDQLIGITDFPRPFYVLTEEELENCKRRLRTVDDGDAASIKIGNVTYCE